MKSDNIFRHALAAFLAALLLYAGLYALDQHLRTRKGAWEVTFIPDTNGAPSLIVEQPGLGIAGLRLTFAGERTTNAFSPRKVRFDRPAQDVPFGEVLYDDLMYLPGAVTLSLFGHEIEFLPRTLILDRKEIPWRSNATFELSARDKPPAGPRKKWK
jgi:hypothetical protein